MSSAQDYANFPRPPLFRSSHLVRPPFSPSANAVASRHLPNPSAAVDRPHLFLARSALGGAEYEKIRRSNTPIKKEMHGAETKEILNDDGAISQKFKEEIYDSTVPAGSKTGVKRQRRTKPKNKLISQLPPGILDGTHSNSLASNSCRYDSSLGLLTKKFIDLLQKAQDGSLDLNSAAETLEVQKRRIYDITNVLEGVGLIEKTFKNKIRWKGINMSRPKELDDQIAHLKVEAETLQSEDRRLDEMIREVEDNLRIFTEVEENQKSLYLTKEDIISLPSFQDATLIAIKAPHGTSLEVPDPDEGVDFPQRRYQIHLRSSIGPIDCYLISNHAEKIETSDQNPELATTNQRCGNGDASVCSTEQYASMEVDHENQPAREILPDSMISNDFTDGFVKIVPSDTDMDADYWLLSEVGVSLTDAWKTECILELNLDTSCIYTSNAYRRTK